MSQRYRRVLAALAVACVVVLAISRFGRPDRPTVAVWRATWLEALSELPDRDTLVNADDPREMCARALGSIREHEARLFPAPDDVIEAAARKWASAALGLYGRCHTHGAHRELDDDFAHVQHIEREIAAMLNAFD